MQQEYNCPSNHYASEIECQAAIELHCQGRSDELARVAGLIATNLVPTWRWRPPLEAEDLIQDAVIQVLTRAHLYVPGRGKAFAYLTTTVRRIFLGAYRQERRRHDITRAYAEHLFREAGGVGEVRRMAQPED